MALPAPTADDVDFYRWYGPWAPLTPPQVAELLSGLAARWWIVGGWAVDAFSGVIRDHEDIDVGFFRADLEAVLAHLSPELCIWSNHSGTIRPLRKPEDLLEGSRQLWVRRDGASPWCMDLAMTPHQDETWICPRDDRIRVPFHEATFVAADGVRYLRPELVLLMKAMLGREKDAGDLRAILPKLETDRRAWLAGSLDLVHPGHAWLTELKAAPRRDGRRRRGSPS